MPELHRFAHRDLRHKLDAATKVVSPEAVPDVEVLEIALQLVIFFRPEVAVNGEVNLLTKGFPHPADRLAQATEVIELGIEDDEAHFVGDFEHVRDSVVHADDIHHFRELAGETLAQLA